MKRAFFIVIVSCVMALHAIAHNAKIGTFTLRDTGAGWFVEMNFAQAGVDAAMIEEYGEKKLKDISEEDYKDLFIKYVRENFNLMVDGAQVKLSEGGVRLGSHQTDLKFILPEIPNNPEEMTIHLPLFSSIHNQTNIFRIYRGEGAFTKFFLSEDNGFTARFAFTQEGIIELELRETENAAFKEIGFLLILILILVVVSRNGVLKYSKLRKA